MRLLNVHTLEFAEFRDDERPTYAIASHRWQEEEVTFQEVNEKRNQSKKGYRKVRDFAKHVAGSVPGVKWLCIDTCCINKDSASELTESINRMFQWYRSAKICLAYLADVSTAGDEQNFMKSEWFKRGWTLQELLAPHTIIFLTRGWRVIGHKADNKHSLDGSSLELGALLNKTIAQITGVSEIVLSDFQRSKSLSNEERLSWMNGRMTTRGEDMSYSLLGIFGVSMPAIYGEGGVNARKRLRSEISKDHALLEKLPVARGAAFDARENEFVSECLPGTRADVLQKINHWASSTDGVCIYWLCGMAGTGKSTIFKTIARTFKDQHRLAASFCFKKGEADRGHASRLVTTIAAQLARQLPDVRQKLISVLEQDSDFIQKSLKEQFQRLIFEPLEQSALAPAYGHAWIIGIDALDECDSEPDISTVVGLLAQLKGLTSTTIRLFISSRPDLPVRVAFSNISKDCYIDIRLEEISKNSVAHDIAIYLRNKLTEICCNYRRLNGANTLRPDWPGEDTVQALVEMAQPLFILAATACRLLEELDQDLEEMLSILLCEGLEATQFDRTYKPVLDRIILNKSSRQQQRTVDEVQTVVGSIIVLAEPLSIKALSTLVDIPETKVTPRLQRLHSVLEVPPPEAHDKPVRPLHPSFGDYLTDPVTQGKTPFWVEKIQMHRKLAQRCLHVLGQQRPLKQDICGVKLPGFRRSKISSGEVAASIASEVTYACKYWVWHLCKAGDPLRDDGFVHQFLLSHFLHWLEALSWLGRLSDVVKYLDSLRSLVEGVHISSLSSFLDDATRFILRNRFIINLAPLQIYSSALVFTPAESIIKSIFIKDIPTWLKTTPRVASCWGPELQSLQGHRSAVVAVTFSPDGHVIASASYDGTIRLWNAETGEQLRQLGDHADYVNDVVFYPDGKMLASSSEDGTVRIWEALTGKEMRKLEGHGGLSVTAMALKGQTLASASRDGTICLWNAITGVQIAKFQGHKYRVLSLAISPRGEYLASASHDRTVRLWSMTTLKEVKRLESHEEWYTCVAFSPDGQTIALASSNWTVRLCSIEAGEDTRRLHRHGDMISPIIFSNDGRTLASASSDETVRIWSTTSGEELGVLKGHSDSVNGLAFSSNGQTIASASDDGTVRLWRSWTEHRSGRFREYNRAVLDVTFSPDGLLVASASANGTVRLWDSLTHGCLQTIKGLRGPVSTLAFSPDSSLLAAATYAGTIRVWNAKTGNKTVAIASSQHVRSLAFSSDGHTLCSNADTSGRRQWDIPSGRKLYSSRDSRDLTNLKRIARGPLPVNVGLFAPITFFARPFEPKEPPALVLNGEWISCGNRDLLWLPTDFRGGVRRAFGPQLVIGQDSGEVSFFTFDLSSDVLTSSEAATSEEERSQSPSLSGLSE